MQDFSQRYRDGFCFYKMANAMIKRLFKAVEAGSRLLT